MPMLIFIRLLFITCWAYQIDLFTPIFAFSRMSGWTAHVLEQLDNNRLIRPRAEYTGEKNLQYESMDKR